MANIIANTSLWTPEGEINLAKPFETANPLEGATLQAMHPVAQKYNIALVCQRCNTSFQGKNNEGDSIYVIACQCREIKFDAPSHQRARAAYHKLASR